MSFVIDLFFFVSNLTFGHLISKMYTVLREKEMITKAGRDRAHSAKQHSASQVFIRKLQKGIWAPAH